MRKHQGYRSPDHLTAPYYLIGAALLMIPLFGLAPLFAILLGIATGYAILNQLTAVTG